MEELTCNESRLVNIIRSLELDILQRKILDAFVTYKIKENEINVNFIPMKSAENIKMSVELK